MPPVIGQQRSKTIFKSAFNHNVLMFKIFFLPNGSELSRLLMSIDEGGSPGLYGTLLGFISQTTGSPRIPRKGEVFFANLELFDYTKLKIEICLLS